MPIRESLYNIFKSRIIFNRYLLLNDKEVIPKYELEFLLYPSLLSRLWCWTPIITITVYGSKSDWRIVPGFKQVIKTSTLFTKAEEEYSRLEYERRYVATNQEHALSYQEKLEGMEKVLKKAKQIRLKNFNNI